MAAPLVLMYHGFGDRSSEQDPQNLFVGESAFVAQLEWLLATGRRPLDHDGFLNGLDRGRWPPGSFLITIDDGYVSTLDVAAPLLARLRVSAVLFALPGLLGGTSHWMPEMSDEPLLDRDQLRRLPDLGVTIALHGLDHTSLAGCGSEQLRRQIAEAQPLLADVTGERPVLFAYPFGHHDNSARSAVANAGFRAAFAIYDSVDRYALPRVDVNALDTPRTFRLKASGFYPQAKALMDRTPRARRWMHDVLGRSRR